MTRLSMAFAGFAIALAATIASAQSYPQPYANPMYGQGPMQAGYGQMPMGNPYAMQAGGAYPMQPGGGYPMQPGMYPGLPNGAYAPAGYPNANYAGAQAQGMMPQAGMVQNQMPQQSPPSNQDSGNSSSRAGQEYHGPQGAISKANPPPAKLPPGVHAENGLLFYNGSPAAPAPDVAYQPMNNSSGSPVRTAAYQAGAENGSNNGQPQTSVMNPGSNYGNGMPAGNAASYGNSMQQNCNQCQNGNNCDDGNCGLFSWLSAPCNCFYGLCHGCMFPGKLGYVWMAGYDNLGMTRDTGQSRVLLRNDTGGAFLPPLFNSDEFNFDWDYGGRMHVELIGPSGLTYQWQYTRVATFVTQPEFNPGAPVITLPGPIANFSGFSDADSATVYYSSGLQTGEFNVIFPFGSFEIVTGYRYMQLDEKSKISTDTSGALATFTAQSGNHMNGGQIGLLGRWEMFGMIDFDFDAKFAVMGNAAETNQIAIDDTRTLVGSASGDKTRVSFVSELGANWVVPIGPSWNIHVGYNVYFIDRVALAPDQFAFNIGSSPSAGTIVDNGGNIVVQGVDVGVTAKW